VLNPSQSNIPIQVDFMLSYPEPIYKEIDIYDSTIDNIEMGAVH